MAFTPDNFLMATRALDKISEEATNSLNRVDGAIAQLVTAASQLQAMQTAWTPAVTFIDDQAIANPTDESWQALKAEKDKLVADFLVMRDLAIAVRNAAQTARG